jgi:hypothetical protein
MYVCVIQIRDCTRTGLSETEKVNAIYIYMLVNEDSLFDNKPSLVRSHDWVSSGAL